MDELIKKKLDDFFSHYKHQKYKKGEILIRADENPTGIFYLTKGYVKVYCISEKGHEVVLNIFKPLSFFPMSWAINNTRNIYFYEAVTEVTIWQAPKEEVLKFITNNPEILLDLLSRVYKGIDGILTRMTYLMLGSAHHRLITEMIIAAKRYGKKDHNNKILIDISEKDLAVQTGLTKETVSREMGKLNKKGLVLFNKKILEVVDIEKLVNELTGNL